MADARPIGIFDSGIGGLTILREVRRQLPQESVLYVADSRHAPYGTKAADDLRERCDQVARLLLDLGAKCIVVACNTASVTALAHLRQRFPVPFVGTVPAVKPAALLTHSGTVGVLATRTTATSEALAELVAAYANGAQVLTSDCARLVALVERGALAGPEVEAAVREDVGPLLDAGADVLVLGCTHLPFLQPAIARLCGPERALIDPSEAVARQVWRVLAERGLLAAEAAPRGPAAPPEAGARADRLGSTAPLAGAADDQAATVRYFTTGDAGQFRRRLGELLGPEAGLVQAVDV